MNMGEFKMSKSFQTMTDQILVFTLEELLYAISLNAVVKVIHAIEIRYLPNAPEIITGIINVRGQIIPVVDIRKRFNLADHEIDLNDRLVIANTVKRQVAILVDTVIGIRDMEPRQFEVAKKILPFAKHISGVAKVDDGLIFIYDLERFLGLTEEKELEKALKTKNK
jgi:purine-binding chemotaxis protein CheW